MIDRQELARKLFMNAARYSGLASVLSPYLSGTGAILMLHRVNRAGSAGIGVNDHLTITPAFLDAVLTTMKKMGYAFLSMDEVVERLESGRTGRFATVTLDDGYLDNLTDALQVFEAHDTPFTIYVAPALNEYRVGLWWLMLEELIARREWLVFMTGDGKVSLDCSTPEAKADTFKQLHDYLTSEIAEQDQQDWLKELLTPRKEGGDILGRVEMMNWDEIRQVAAHKLGTIGAHTVHHYNLRRLSAQDAMREIVDSGDIIAMETGMAPRHFAYPYGHAGAVGSREVELVREAGYASAVTTRHGMLQPGHRDHLHALPRISVNGRYQQLGYVRTMLSGLTTLADSRKRLVTV
jgi:peptidoglycan/xylan/chitin deacetylase (PgdA/CDA1 family)